MPASWWVNIALELGGPSLLIAWLIWGIVSVTLHELSHGWTAVRLGDHTPIHSGHMTWNPLVHMGVRGVIFLVLIGLPAGAMPVDPTRMRGRHADAVMALAGPLMNFALFIICVFGGAIAFAMLDQSQTDEFLKSFKVDAASPIAAKIAYFFGVGSVINIALGIFNLFPVPPLDGSWILASFWRWYGEMIRTQFGQFLSMLLFAVCFLFAGPLIFLVGFGTTFILIGGLSTILKLIGLGP